MDELERTQTTMGIPDWTPGFVPPTDAEIVLGYWKAQAEGWARAHHERLADYDALTARLAAAFGDDWQQKVEKAIERKGRAR